MGSTMLGNDGEKKIRFIPMTYNSTDSQTSALRLILALFPEWERTEGKIEFVRFTDGITNTLLKVVNRRPGLSEEQIDNEAVLLRAYGKGTDVLIDRDRETQNHELLMRYNLAPNLLARFHNGMLYRFMRGSVTSPEDLRQEPIWRAVARKLAEWHAVVPCIPAPHPVAQGAVDNSADVDMPLPIFGRKYTAMQLVVDDIAPGKPVPNAWVVMQKWIYALPIVTEAQKARKAELQEELNKTAKELSDRPGLGVNGLVFAHCDLLSGNVIVRPQSASGSAEETAVSFIDYEYATPSPAAFDIANHFSEWGGFDCDHNVLPTKAQRQGFIEEYIKSYYLHKGEQLSAEQEKEEAEMMFKEVDTFRGVPGLYWGIWAIIQATISQIDFDYASYAEIRLDEYWGWREEASRARAAAGKERTTRERRWAQES